MNDISLYYLPKTFNPTPSKIGISESYTMLRETENTKWLSNMQWAILADCQPSFFKRMAKCDQKIPDKAMDSILKKETKTLVEPVNELKIQQGVVLIKMKNHKFNSWLNVHFLSLIAKLEKTTGGLKFYQEHPEAPIFVRADNFLIAVLMPVRKD